MAYTADRLFLEKRYFLWFSFSGQILVVRVFNAFFSFSTHYFGAWGGVVVKALRYLGGRSRDRFPVVSLDFSVTYFSRPYHGLGVDSAPSENENQEHFLGVKAAGA